MAKANSNGQGGRRRAPKGGKLDHGRILGEIVEKSIDSIRPAPENELIYRPVASDPETIALSKSIRKHGVKEPLVITLDGFIMSGHRRHAAAKLAGLKSVPCRVENIRRTDPRFVEMLREYNRQRVKTLAEITREEVVSADPEEAHRLLVEHRRRQSAIDAPDAIEIIGHKHRAEISDAKRPLLAAIKIILTELRSFWPLSVRQIHYQLLNNPPLIHASKPRSRYENTPNSYKAAVDLIAHRLAGLISWNAVNDETRTVETWKTYQSIAPFMRDELGSFLKGFYRDLLQSQTNQIEVIGEKNTIKGVIRPLAMEYCLPFTIGRGYSSLPPRQKMAERFSKSGKEKLILLVVSDFDPEGEDIAHSFARSMRDDFDISDIVPIKVALTREQVDRMNLAPVMKAKETSSRHDKFVERHGDDVFELEAVQPVELQRILRTAIDSVLDITAFNREIDAEKKDAAHLDVVRRGVQTQLRDFDFDD